MKLNENTIEILEDSNMVVSIHEESIVELETWTKGGVNKIILLRDIEDDNDILKGLKEYEKNFSIDDEIDMYRQEDTYKETFTIKESLEDFEDYLGCIDLLIFRLSKLK